MTPTSALAGGGARHTTVPRTPGLDSRRLARLMDEAVRRCRLNLTGATVLTEAASGAYVVTPVLAALAGARVIAVTRSTRHGSVEDVTAETLGVAASSGVDHAIEIVTEVTPRIAAAADIVTNSGHVRPLNAQLLAHCKPSVVIPLMYEAWELRDEDVDLSWCEQHNVPVAGTNEQHQAVGVFPFLGIMAVKLLNDAGVSVFSSRLLLLCDNEFETFIAAGLRSAGASVDVATEMAAVAGGSYDAIVVALRPRPDPVLGAETIRTIARRCPGAVVAQYWGDIDREACAAHAVPAWPLTAPAPGHMGVLPSAVGPEPIVRLQAGGLKVGEVLFRARAQGATAAECLDALRASGFGTFLPAAPPTPLPGHRS